MPTPEQLEEEIRRLLRAREALLEQRERLKGEELKVLADAYARKLDAAGLSIEEGIAALKPYAAVLRRARQQVLPLEGGTGPAAAASEAGEGGGMAGQHGASAIDPSRPSPGPGNDLHRRAQEVLGTEGGKWLRRPHPLLGGHAPLHVARTPDGHQRVIALLAAYARGA